MSPQIFFSVIVSIFVGFAFFPCPARAQSDPYRTLIEEYRPLIMSSNLRTTDVRSKYSKMDLSDVWLEVGEKGYLGFIGKEFARLRLKLEKVVKDQGNDNLYHVAGRSAISNRVVSIRGTIEVREVFELKGFVLGVDEEPPDNGIISQGLTLGKYVLGQDKTFVGAGVFEGIFSLRWYIDSKGVLRFDDLQKFADPFRNNQFVGTWTRYDGKEKRVANWGDYRIPNSGDLDIGACCFSPNPKYRLNGWKEFVVDQPDEFDWNRR